MSEGNTTLHTPAKRASKSNPDKKTITLTFEGDDVKLHEKITKDAERDERTPPVNLLRFLRKHYDASSQDESA